MLSHLRIEASFFVKWAGIKVNISFHSDGVKLRTNKMKVLYLNVYLLIALSNTLHQRRIQLNKLLRHCRHRCEVKCISAISYSSYFFKSYGQQMKGNLWSNFNNLEANKWLHTVYFSLKGTIKIIFNTACTDQKVRPHKFVAAYN